ncbi:MAG: transposase [Pseudomonadota bacterium]|uniref:REP-associated tyrosine transposase n=1 Tax=Alcanivorax sp. TaxID=1872427 RepID=UPI0025B8084A|nr:transposase [Alcanivorax sp.]MED5239393.1 transposase [Pseudomonadota bacterium]MEE3319342.1 transposase [Pseudomonadota bacterium]
MKTHFKSKALRQGRYSAADNIYLVTTACHERTPTFLLFSHARIAINAIRHSDMQGFSSTYAFVIMPDHLHWLFQLGSKDKLSRVVQRVKSQVSREIRQSDSSKQQVWQSGFHDHAVRDEESLVEIARYIVANPLRARLVLNVGDYPHWDCIWVGEGDVL